MSKVVITALALFWTILTAAEAQAATISGVVRFWDTRFFRSDLTGSRLSQASAATNQTMAGVRVYVVDQDGGCIDVSPGCPDATNPDDDVLISVYTASNGSFSVNIPDNQQVYLMSDYTTIMGSGADLSLNLDFARPNGYRAA